MKNRRARRPRWPAVAGLVMVLGGGCVSERGVDIDRYLGAVDLPPEAGPIGERAAGDRPDSPVSALPSFSGDEEEIEGAEVTIQKDCLLRITVKEDPALNGTYPVNEIGAVQLGYVGPVILYNKTAVEAERKIESVLESRAFHEATVGVRILRASYDKVEVTGAVGKPGIIRIGAGDSISLNDALLRAGGLKVAPRQVRIMIVREGLLSAVAPALGGEVYTLVDAKGKPFVPDVELRNNDIAYVHGVGVSRARPEIKHVLVLGEVKKEGFYRFAGTEGCTLMNLVFKMGGLPPYANDRAIRIIRRDEFGQEEEMRVNARRILKEGNPDYDVPLEDGDRVIIPARRISLF